MHHDSFDARRVQDNLAGKCTYLKLNVQLNLLRTLPSTEARARGGVKKQTRQQRPCDKC